MYERVHHSLAVTLEQVNRAPRFGVRILERVDLAQLPLDAPLRPRAYGCPIPLTALQLRFWSQFIKDEKPLSRRVCASSVWVFGSLNVRVLQENILTLVQRHESLRTRFITVGGSPRQHVDVVSEYHLDVIDLSALPRADAEREAMHRTQEFLDQRIDLSVGPLFEAKLWKLSDVEHVLILVVDHMVSDGLSYGILNRELWGLYNQSSQGVSFSLPPLPVQFGDYAIWQHQTQVAWTQKHKSYWENHLSGKPRVEVPLDTELDQRSLPTSATLHIPLSGTASTNLSDLARRLGAPLYLLVMVVYVVVMSRWCNQEALLVELPTHGRHNRPELQNMFGFIANFLYLRIAIEKGDTFHELLRRIQREISAAFEHQDYDRVPDIVDDCRTDISFHWRSANWSPPVRESRRVGDGNLKMRPFSTRSLPWPLKFWCAFYETRAGIFATVEYRSDILAARSLKAFRDSLRSVAEELALRPQTRLDSVLTVNEFQARRNHDG